MPNAIIGINEYLVDYLNELIRPWNSIRFIVAFLMESGAKLLSKELADAVQRGVPVRILTGRYLDVTEPSALYYLKDKLGDGVEIKFADVYKYKAAEETNKVMRYWTISIGIMTVNII